MKSQLKKFDQIAFDQIDAIFEEHMEGNLTLICCEFNNEVVVGFVDLKGRVEYDNSEDETESFNLLDEYFVINLPINLVEYSGYDEDDKLHSSYKFYPYKQIADEICEVLLKTSPEVMFFPNDNIIATYFSYWKSYKELILDEYKDQEDIYTFGVSTLAKS